MRAKRPVLKEPLLAVATFGGIALATAMALDFLVTGGFEIVPERQQSPYVDPFAFAAVSGVEWAPPQSMTTTSVAWSEPTLLEEAANEDLAGGQNADLVRHEVAPSEDELYREIAALYAAQDARAEAAEADDAEEPAYLEAPAYEDAEPMYEEDAPALDEEDITKPASETESPL